MIKPTVVGRVVWFYPSTRTGSSDFHPPTLNDPLAAIVAKVVGAQFVDLAVFDAHGHSHSMIDVPLLQDGDDAPAEGYYATWMPYQIDQAKKADDARQLTVAADREADDKRWRAGMLDMALRTPHLVGYEDVLKAAQAYQAHIEGTATAPALQPLAERPDLGAAFHGYSTMLPHQQRVVDELVELNEKLTKLESFVDTPVFAGLDEAERNRLMAQHGAMFAYSTILQERIAAFAPAASNTSGLPG